MFFQLKFLKLVFQNSTTEKPKPTNECPEYQERTETGDCRYINACAKQGVVELCGSNEQCISEFGKARCVCLKGFAKNSTSAVCEDVNECETESICQYEETCRNLVGSFECVCREGFKMGMWNGELKCISIQYCLDPALNTCNHICEGYHGGFYCECFRGYSLHKDGATCVEDSPCHSSSFCDGICEKSEEGGHSCKRCPNGLFKIGREPQTCFRVNESHRKCHSCPPGETFIGQVNGDPQCVDLACPEDYENDKEEGVCRKKQGIQDDQPLAISKRVIHLSSKDMELKNWGNVASLTLYRFKNPDGLTSGDLQFKIEIVYSSAKEYPVKFLNFIITDQKISHNLLLVNSIREEQQFTLDVNFTHKGTTMHAYRLYVFV